MTEYKKPGFGRYVGFAGFFIIALVILSIIGGSFYTIDQGERGVVLRNGAVIATAEPGLGFKVPFIDKVKTVSVQTMTRTYTNVAAYSRDQQTAMLALSLTWHIPADRVDEVYSNFGSEEGLASRILDRKLNEEVKNVFGQFNAVSAIAKRDEMIAQMQERVRAAIVGPVSIDALQLENIDFSDTYEKSIEDRMLAEVEVQKVRQNAEREKVQAEIKVIQAQADADAAVAAAEAEAKATRLRGEAEAAAITARAKALGENPSLIELTKAERWNGVLPTTMLPGGTIPFIDALK